MAFAISCCAWATAGNMIKEYFLNYEAMNNDFTICLGEKSQIQYHGSHDEQELQRHAGRHRPGYA